MADWTPGRPDASTVAAVFVLFALVGGLGAIQSAVKIEQVSVDDETYETAAWMATYADERGWEGRAESYVFSRWGQNRLYNYFVNGDAESYGYAQSNYGQFISETDPQVALDSIDGRVRFVVTEDQSAEDTPPESMQTRLHDNWGSHSGSVEGVGQFRALYASESGARKVFMPVSGALLVGSVDSSGTVEVSADVEIPNAAFTYRRQTTTTENGWYVVRVPYPVSYTAGGSASSTVTEREVLQGKVTSEREPQAHWSFDEGRGEYVFDSIGGNHGSAENMAWTDGIQNQSLKITDGRYAQVPNPLTLQESQSFTLSVWFKTNGSVNYTADREFPRIAAAAPSGAYKGSEGYQIAMSRSRLLATLGNGSQTVRLFGGDVADDQWHHAALVWNGTTVRLYRDGQIVDSGQYEGELGAETPLVFGASASRGKYFAGQIDEGRYYNRSLSPAEIRQLYSKRKPTAEK